MSQFCPHAEKAKRCVLYVGHIGQHDLQGLGSASVKAIMNREALEERLSPKFAPGGGQFPIVEVSAEDSIKAIVDGQKEAPTED